MPAGIKVFICYKKILANDRPNEKAEILHFTLAQDSKQRFDPWVDDAGLPAGLAWETEIYRRILASDVLLVLIGPGTSESQWVRREIALATALGISIVPLGFDLTQPELNDELKALQIAHLQGKITQNIRLNAREALLTELSSDLHSACVRTKEQQNETLRDLFARRNPPTQRAADKQKAATFPLSVGQHSIQLHIASGDMARVRHIDVLVNSENDYMQMARFFEVRTVSSMLRRRGARLIQGKYEDTIQQELDWQLRDCSRPVHSGDVFVTSAGAPQSELSKINKARYIFHVAAVQAVDAEGIVIPFKQPHQIEACVRTSLSKLKELNQLKGVISPPGSEQRQMQEKLASEGGGAVRSILFPLFGTGHGGSAAAEVIGPILSAITGFFEDEEDGELASVLDEIYISAFKQQDVDEVLQALTARYSGR
jgi:O-acetyl-ADP-ribose deacetylase (regulator of RNase III)